MSFPGLFVQISSRPKFPVSGDKNGFCPPGTRNVPFTQEFHDLFQGNREGTVGGGGRGLRPSSSCHF